VRAVVFDFFGTLTDPGLDDPRRAAFEATGLELGVDPARFMEAMRASVAQRSTGMLGDTRSTLRVIARRCGVEVDDATCERARRLHLAAYPKMLRPHPHALDVLHELASRGFKLGLLSDCSSELVELWEATPFAPLIDTAVFSSEVGVAKPARGGYAACAARLGVRSSDCWFVGDGSSSEHSGAKAVGMRPVLVSNSRYDVGYLRSEPDTFVPPDVIDDLSDLPPLVGTPD
jgi:putative hydrolase of the HAD superfamily